MSKQIIFAVLLVTLASVQAKYDIRYALPEQMVQYLAQKTSAFSEFSFNLTNSNGSIQLRLEGMDTALYFQNGSADVESISQHVEKVEFAIRFGSVDLIGQFTATVNGKKYRGLLNSILVYSTNIYFDVYYNNLTGSNIVQVDFGGATKYIHSLSWDDCELYNSQKDCSKAEKEILKSVEQELSAVLRSKVKIAIFNYGAPFQYKESPDVTDMPTTTARYWPTEYPRDQPSTRWWRN